MSVGPTKTDGDRTTAEVTADTEWTCRFMAAGLTPATEYWYRFTDADGNGSRVGRTLTSPREGDARGPHGRHGHLR